MTAACPRPHPTKRKTKEPAPALETKEEARAPTRGLLPGVAPVLIAICT